MGGCLIGVGGVAVVVLTRGGEDPRGWAWIDVVSSILDFKTDEGSDESG